MGVAVGLILIAFGAILVWAVNATVSGIDVDALGAILLVLGILIVFLDLLWWRSWAGGPWRRTTYVEGAPPAAGAPPVARSYWPGRRRAVVEEDLPPGPPPGAPPPP